MRQSENRAFCGLFSELLLLTTSRDSRETTAEVPLLCANLSIFGDENGQISILTVVLFSIFSYQSTLKYPNFKFRMRDARIYTYIYLLSALLSALLTSGKW